MSLALIWDLLDLPQKYTKIYIDLIILNNFHWCYSCNQSIFNILLKIQYTIHLHWHIYLFVVIYENIIHYSVHFEVCLKIGFYQIIPSILCIRITHVCVCEKIYTVYNEREKESILDAVRCMHFRLCTITAPYVWKLLAFSLDMLNWLLN